MSNYSYQYDIGLEFLKFCTLEDLSFLELILIPEYSEFLLNQENEHNYWQDLSACIQDLANYTHFDKLFHLFNFKANSLDYSNYANMLQEVILEHKFSTSIFLEKYLSPYVHDLLSAIIHLEEIILLHNYQQLPVHLKKQVIEHFGSLAAMQEKIKLLNDTSSSFLTSAYNIVKENAQSILSYAKIPVDFVSKLTNLKLTNPVQLQLTLCTLVAVLRLCVKAR